MITAASEKVELDQAIECHRTSILSKKSERRLVQGGADGMECFVFRGDIGGGHGIEKREEALACLSTRQHVLRDCRSLLAADPWV